jgi:hypothetical protein
MSSFGIRITTARDRLMASPVILVRIDARVKFISDVGIMRAGSASRAAFAVISSVA